MQTTRWQLRIGRSEISYLRFIIESYDGLAIVSTLDPIKGLVELKIAPGCETEIKEIIRDLRNDILIEEII